MNLRLFSSLSQACSCIICVSGSHVCYQRVVIYIYMLAHLSCSVVLCDHLMELKQTHTCMHTRKRVHAYTHTDTHTHTQAKAQAKMHTGENDDRNISQRWWMLSFLPLTITPVQQPCMYCIFFLFHRDHEHGRCYPRYVDVHWYPSSVCRSRV